MIAILLLLLLLNTSVSLLTSVQYVKYNQGHFVIRGTNVDTNEGNFNDEKVLEAIRDQIAYFVTNTTTDIDTEALRAFHGRGGMYPGCEHVTLDWFPPVWLLTSHNKRISNHTLKLVQDTMREVLSSTEIEGVFNLIYQFRNDTWSDTQILSGTIPKPHVVTENGIKILVNLVSGKNHGIFLDMANGRKWVQENTEGHNVLNLFAYTCGFSLAALQGNATQVVNIDMAAGPMKNGKRNHELNNFTGGARFLTHNIFKTWGKIRKLGPYDTIIVDPPSFQKNSFIAKKDYGKIIRRLPDLMAANGNVLLCLNAPELDTQWLQEQVTEYAADLKFVERIPNPSSFPALYPEKALKVMAYKKKD